MRRWPLAFTRSARASRPKSFYALTDLEEPLADVGIVGSVYRVAFCWKSDVSCRVSNRTRQGWASRTATPRAPALRPCLTSVAPLTRCESGEAEQVGGRQTPLGLEGAAELARLP